MLRATVGVSKGQGRVVAEYLELRDFWNVTPLLETMLKSQLASWIGEKQA